MAQLLDLKNNTFKEFSYIDYSSSLNQTDKFSKCLFFEKVVIDHLNPEKKSLEGLFFFKQFDIGKTISIPQLMPKKNKKLNLANQIRISVKNKSFLLKPNTIFGQKSLIDAIFINVNDKNEADLYCFYISAKTIKKDKFNSNHLKENFKIMKQYISNFFDFKINSVYFTIILDYNLSKKRETFEMLKNLYNYKINFIFFDLESLVFKDISGNIMNAIKSSNNLEINNEKYIEGKIKDKNYELNNQQKGTIKEILRKTYKKLDSEFHFLKNDFLYAKNIVNDKSFGITETPKNLFQKVIPETFMIYKGIDKKMNFIKLNKKGGYEIQSDLIYDLFLSNDYDFYKID